MTTRNLPSAVRVLEWFMVMVLKILPKPPNWHTVFVTLTTIITAIITAQAAPSPGCAHVSYMMKVTETRLYSRLELSARDGVLEPSGTLRAVPQCPVVRECSHTAESTEYCQMKAIIIVRFLITSTVIPEWYTGLKFPSQKDTNLPKTTLRLGI